MHNKFWKGCWETGAVWPVDRSVKWWICCGEKYGGASKTNTELPYDTKALLLGIVYKMVERRSDIDICTATITVALFIIKMMRQPECPSGKLGWLNPHCQCSWVWSHLGGTLLHVSMSVIPEDLAEKHEEISEAPTFISLLLSSLPNQHDQPSTSHSYSHTFLATKKLCPFKLWAEESPSLIMSFQTVSWRTTFLELLSSDICHNNKEK